MEVDAGMSDRVLGRGGSRRFGYLRLPPIDESLYRMGLAAMAVGLACLVVGLIYSG